MNLAVLFSKYWDVIAANPVFFVTNALAFGGVGFFIGKLVYGTIATITKERLEAARDDAARLEKAKKDESDTVAKLQDELTDCLQSRSKTVQVPVQQTKPATNNPASVNSEVFDRSSTGVINADSFFLSIPHRSLEDALKEAQKTQKLVFAVIYDETHPKLSKLIYSLGYFMEYHTTKKLVDEYFVIAILKASHEEVTRLVPSDDPLENCLWVVMTPSGKILKREGVYANPDEGLKRVRAVIADVDKL
ncbi:hypothetical protein [Pantoea sp. CCBC3-3-1]|uniref:hypothetical protein n=1 Tax=Pantoea sp. CCBC3-3-1 TaxID=2490851 RepID=UPI0011BFC9B8|nr:hypothetical protein [Pantoea sp. CCBC3-3-1]